MEYIECPKEWNKTTAQAVFLAGGITGCPNWQSKMVRLLHKTDYVVLNPRREKFPINDPGAAIGQIAWEFDHLRKADIISFWFCKETIQPIVLYELGAWSMTDKPIFIGVEPGYERIADVRIQTALIRPKVRLLNTLEELASAIKLFKPVPHTAT